MVDFHHTNNIILSAFITGKYGYVDELGVLQVLGKLFWPIYLYRYNLLIT